MDGAGRGRQLPRRGVQSGLVVLASLAAGVRTSLSRTVYGNLYKLSGVVGKAPAGNAFTMVFGGGVDIPLNHSGTVAIRPGEIDYLYTRFDNAVTGAQSNLRYQAGIVFNFGGR